MDPHVMSLLCVLCVPSAPSCTVFMRLLYRQLCSLGIWFPAHPGVILLRVYERTQVITETVGLIESHDVTFFRVFLHQSPPTIKRL